MSCLSGNCSKFGRTCRSGSCWNNWLGPQMYGHHGHGYDYGYGGYGYGYGGYYQAPIVPLPIAPIAPSIVQYSDRYGIPTSVIGFQQFAVGQVWPSFFPSGCC